uniref:Uncharacterized protein n=1 Tax=Rhizophora mucronata TaxID=61149 RepID=A0A2P2KC71_RHIMU
MVEPMLPLLLLDRLVAVKVALKLWM